MRQLILSVVAVLMIAAGGQAQSNVDSKPSFPGGDEAMNQYFVENLVYPPMALENGIEGVVTIDFLVKADGSIGDIKIVRMVDPDLEEEAIRIVKSMPKWNPGVYNGVAVDSWFRVPIKFRLPAN